MRAQCYSSQLLIFPHFPHSSVLIELFPMINQNEIQRLIQTRKCHIAVGAGTVEVPLFSRVRLVSFLECPSLAKNGSEASGSSHSVESSCCSAQCCRYCWLWAHLCELLKVSTGSAISFLAPLLSDKVPSGYVVIMIAK